MLYTVELPIPANTDKLNPVRQTIKVWRGVINRIRITFPTGCVGLAHIRILHGGHQIAPVNEGSWFSGDGGGPDYQEFIPLQKEINELTIEGYNEDDTYPHKPIVEISVLPYEVLAMPTLDYDLVYAMVRLMGEVKELITKLKEKGG